MRTTERNFAGRTAPDLRLLGLAALLALLVAAGGCDDDPACVDTEPPAVPTGVFTITGDGVVSVYWNDLYVLDLAGYAVYRHDGDDPQDGPYYWLGDVAWDENFDEETLLHWFDDDTVVNGETYYYAVLAFDSSGNESQLSFETVGDTPRPEGIEMMLFDRDGPFPERSGFDFSALGAGRLAWNDPAADVFVVYEGGVPFVRAARPGVVRLQDYGTIPLYLVDYAPAAGYSETGRAELIEGHSYIVEIAEDPESDVNYAKFFVYADHGDRVEIDWAYQADDFNRELKLPADERLEPDGAGAGRIVRY